MTSGRAFDARIERVRQLVAQAFVETGLAEPTDVRETILIRDGYYCGRRFETETAAAIWLVEASQVKVFRDDGTVVLVLDVGPATVNAAA